MGNAKLFRNESQATHIILVVYFKALKPLVTSSMSIKSQRKR